MKLAGQHQPIRREIVLSKYVSLEIVLSKYMCRGNSTFEICVVVGNSPFEICLFGNSPFEIFFVGINRNLIVFHGGYHALF